MGLFSITCQSCAARLTVRHQSAIGQVLACPKCGSMLQVEAPEGWEPESRPEPAARSTGQKNAGRRRKARAPAAAGDLQTTLSNDFGEVDSLLDDQSPQHSQAAVASRFAHEPATPMAAPSIKADSSPPVQPVADQPVLPNDQWTSAETRRRRKAFAWLTGILAGGFVVLVIGGYVLTQMLGTAQSGDETEQVAKSNPTENSAAGDQSSDTTNQASADDLTDDGTVPVPIADKDTSLPDDVSDGDPNPTQPSADAAQPTVPPVDTETDNPPPTTEGSGDEPFAVDEETNQPLAAVQNNAANDSIIDDLGSVGEILFDPGVDMDQLRDATTDAHPSPVGIGKVFVPRPDPLEIEASRQLTEVFPEIRIDQMSLIQFARLVNRLTSIPVQLDAGAVMNGQIDPRQMVGVHSTDATADAILRAALEPIDLTYRVSPDDRVIIIAAQDDAGLIQSEYEVDPQLGFQGERTALLMEMIQLTIEPGSWNVNGGEAIIEHAADKLLVNQTPNNHRDLGRFLNLLNAAAALKQNPGDETARQQLASRVSRTRLIGEVSSAFELLQRQPVADVLNQIERNDGITVLVDWSALGPLGWHPGTEIPWPSKGQDVLTTLNDIAASMGLVVRSLAENTLEITTRDQWHNSAYLEIYPCNDLLDKQFTHQQIIKFLEDRIASSLPSHTFTAVYFELQTSSVVSVLPEPLQARAEAVLDQLRKSR